ncbi:succinyl-CoA synthetase, beta subunit [Hyphomicrobium denitrificans ATCC 51888]|jgi:succinyl-CoA synthetase beta subunit|uniref:Succinate--CoA ligase [ADP-forming] subunit beta n=1 Tax=Hyphomicrobium denitrificans (strain ATCC 51888 / DSM 1869 / NCIMB 11706 / TK 0415) TaxID=582899 RepID=D8JWR5_HYPDA|nr:ADP-forming succinate--CoA ligase subunit beta [Hyphomicrobium denitrificans]ADJ25023.1 succinyl-CoA synthetase, beta subunit [Hyphomicrobium denitrificans ATCC 51888]
MNIHEYQAKELYRAYGVPTPNGFAAFSVAEAVEAAKKLPGPVWVVKAQIHAGGRGKGKFLEASAGDKGGVRLAKSIDEVKEFAEQMLGKTLVTVQTGNAGRVVNRLYIEDGSAIDRELYLSALVDRSTSRVAFIVSQAGGMNIEDVAHETPEKIHTLTIDPATGYQPFHGRKVAFALGLKGDQVKAAGKLVENLYRMVVEKDMSLLEINPLVVTKDGKLICLDGKMNFDSNALYRHPEIVELRDLGEEDQTEIEASKHDLAFVKLDGNIGCLVNGAGLAMATMDIIKLYGAEPANFLDVGGGASKEKVREAFKIILADPSVKGILVNIFGGIMRCDIIAEGVIAAAREMDIKVPLVVRLEGTNVDLGKKILKESGLKIIPADDLADAAKKITDELKQVA